MTLFQELSFSLGLWYWHEHVLV